MKTEREIEKEILSQPVKAKPAHTPDDHDELCMGCCETFDRLKAENEELLGICKELQQKLRCGFSCECNVCKAIAKAEQI